MDLASWLAERVQCICCAALSLLTGSGCFLNEAPFLILGMNGL